VLKYREMNNAPRVRKSRPAPMWTAEGRRFENDAFERSAPAEFAVRMPSALVARIMIAALSAEVRVLISAPVRIVGRSLPVRRRPGARIADKKVP
jgi:hypothetical protein